MTIIEPLDNPYEHEAYWRAFYVKPRHEKKVSERLKEAGFVIFCPLIKTKVKWHDRWKKVQKPWINGYIFACVTESERMELLQDPSVVSTVTNRCDGKNLPAEIREEEIQAMKLMTKEAKEVQTLDLKKGQKVSVKHGPMSGTEGIIEKLGENQVGIRLESLNMQLVVTVEPSDVALARD